MPELKLKQTSPYTRERAERLQRKYLQMNAVGLATMSAGHAALGLFYGDALMALYFGVFLVFGLGYGSFLRGLSHNTYVLIGEILIVLGVAGSQVLFPKGAASAVLLFPLGVTLMAFSQTLLRGGGVFVIGLLVFFSFSFFGFSSPTDALVPQILSYSVTLFYSGIVLSFQLNKARKSVEYALSTLVETEAELNVKENVLKNYQEKLSFLNEELNTRNNTLLNTLHKESETNSKLEVERSNQEELTKAIHRDLRTPLRSIVAASEELATRFESTPAAKPVASYLSFATDGAKRMTAMLDDLLEYTRGNESQSLEQVDLNVVLATLRQDLAALIERSGASVEVASLPTVVGFSTQLTQLFQNLLSNALKFSRPGVLPEVSIFPAEDQDKEGYFMIRVRDNGIGIPANQLDSVFGLFNRAHSEDGYEGSGVGLALCRRIAVAHDAELSVASVYGEGTQFTISIPCSSITSFSERMSSTSPEVIKSGHHELS